MKLMKILILAVVTATALVASVGGGTASATPTTLCKIKHTTNGFPKCPAGKMYTENDQVHAVLETGSKLVIESGLGKAECTESTFSGKPQQETGMPLIIVMEAFTANKCGEYTVFVTPTSLAVEIIDLPVWTHNGTLTLEAEVVVQKGAKECIYSTGHTGVLTGGAPATVDLSGTLTKLPGGEECPAGNGKWSGNYVTTTSMWVAE